jgi:hypothetical protein
MAQIIAKGTPDVGASFAPIRAVRGQMTGRLRVWYQLPDPFLLPRPDDVGIALY